MANVRYKTTIELDVEVVGHYTGETLPRGLSGPPDLSEPGEPEDFELEAVILEILPGSKVNVIEVLSEAERETLKRHGIDEARDQMESDMLEREIARAEARRDSEEDR